MNRLSIRDRVLAVESRRVLRNEHIAKGKIKVSVEKKRKEKELNEMWAGVAEYFACDGACPICLLAKEKFMGKHQRKEREVRS